MKVFISWSKQTSFDIAQALRTHLLQRVFPEVEFFLSESISPGVIWRNELANALYSCDFGVVCVTPENAQEPWLFFESGALSKVQSAGTVIPYCFEFSPSSLPQPLSGFQSCVADRNGTLNLIRSINATSKTLHQDHV